MLDFIYKIDFAINDFIAEHFVFAPATPIMDGLSFLGEIGWIWILTAIMLLIFKKTRKAGVTVATALILSFLITNLTMKPLINRPRPWVYAAEHLNRTITPIARIMPGDASFPSGHASISFAGAVAVFTRFKKWGAVAIVLASLIAYSRLYFYLHFPTDVLAGMLFGTLYAIAAYFIVNKAYKVIESKTGKTLE